MTASSQVWLPRLLCSGGFDCVWVCVGVGVVLGMGEYHLTSMTKHALVLYYRYMYAGYKTLVDKPSIFEEENLPESMLTFKNQLVMMNDPGHLVINDIINFTDCATDIIDVESVYRAFRDHKNQKGHVRQADFLATLKLYVSNAKHDAWIEPAPRSVFVKASGVPTMAAKIRSFKFRHE